MSRQNGHARKLSEFKTATRNANKHTEYGMMLLDKAMSEVGYVAPVTVAADGESLDGSARLETAAVRFDGVEPIIVESDGTRPIVHIRTDIANAHTPKAKRIAIAANEIHHVDYDPDADIIADLYANERDVLDGLMTDERIAEIIGKQAKEETADVGELIDRAGQLQAKWQVARGDIWQCGRHRLMCGDSTNAEDVARLMQGEKARLVATDPPYNAGKDYGEHVDDEKSANDYENFSKAWLALWTSVSEKQIVTPGTKNITLWCRWFDAQFIAPRTLPFSHSNGSISNLCSWEPIFFFGKGWGKKRANDIFEFGVGFDKTAVGHPVPKPVAMWSDLIDNYSDDAQIVADAFLGSGTTLVACEQTGRVGRGMEIEPKYCAVTLERLSALGLTCERVTP